MFDTHCHLNFKVFRKNLTDVIKRAREAGVNYFVVPGTDVETSKKAVEIAEKNEGVYAAVGIHPHHVFNKLKAQISTPIKSGSDVKTEIQEIETLLKHRKVVAIGEVGIDRHIYQQTKYQNYQIGESFIDLQKEFLKSQIDLAIKYGKSLILHNWEAKEDLLDVIAEPAYVSALAGKAVFHCCEPDFAKASSGKPDSLLDYAIKHRIFIGVDGDVTYDDKSFGSVYPEGNRRAQDKQEFVKKIPLELLVLETDSPYLLPEPLRKNKLYPNEPKSLKIIAEFISSLINVPINRLIEVTTQNARNLFNI